MKHDIKLSQVHNNNKRDDRSIVLMNLWYHVQLSRVPTQYNLINVLKMDINLGISIIKPSYRKSKS